MRWSLVVATVDRPRMLRASVSLALVQDRPPSEVVVVDASEDWEASRLAMLPLAAAYDVPYHHVAAEERSLTVQRNQGIRLASSDVVFLLDDDSLMHPGCAAEVMRVYDADEGAEVVGVQTALSPAVPSTIQIGGMRKITGARPVTDARPSSRLSRRLHLYIWREWFLMDGERLFIPYDDEPHLRQPPASVARLPVARVALFHGCRMTYRRALFETEQFEPLLRAYCPGEDLDFSYRASRHGALVTARDARIHHFQSAEARLDRRVATTLSVLNQAAMLRRHAVASRRWQEFTALNRRRLLVEAVKDLFSRRWRFPQLRGVWDARVGVRLISRMSGAELDRAYPRIQEDVLQSRRLAWSRKV